jgi:MFS family permease
MGIFSATTVLLRPFVGKSADHRGRRVFILLGTCILALCAGLYTFARTVPLLLGLRVIHGVGWASFGTSINALVADVVPRSRAGEAMGYYGMFSNLAMAIGPAIGVILMTGYSFTVLFLASATLAVVSALLSSAIREPRRTASPVETKVGNQGIIGRTALFPSLILTLITITYGSIVTFVPLYAAKQGIGNPGFFFTACAIALIAARGFTGQLSDRYGQPAVIVPGLALATTALWILAGAGSFPAFLLAAWLYGLAFAAMQPAIMAMVVDRAAPSRRGAAMGTFSAAMDLGIGIGSVAWGIEEQPPNGQDGPGAPPSTARPRWGDPVATPEA